MTLDGIKTVFFHIQNHLRRLVKTLQNDSGKKFPFHDHPICTEVIVFCNSFRLLTDLFQLILMSDPGKRNQKMAALTHTQTWGRRVEFHVLHIYILLNWYVFIKDPKT